MGKIYSNRLISLGLAFNFSAITLTIRKLIFKDADLALYKKLENLKKSWFYKDSQIETYKLFFDSEVQLTALEIHALKYELAFAYELCKKTVNFNDVRNNIFSFNDNFIFKNFKTENFILTDSSNKQLGIFIKRKDKYYSHAIQFDHISQEKYSINIKEFTAVILGVIFATRLDKIENKYLNYLCLIDNETARCLSTTKSANIKSVNLGKLGCILNMIQYLSLSTFNFERMSTTEIWIADTISRDPNPPSRELGFNISTFINSLYCF